MQKGFCGCESHLLSMAGFYQFGSEGSSLAQSFPSDMVFFQQFTLPLSLSVGKGDGDLDFPEVLNALSQLRL